MHDLGVPVHGRDGQRAVSKRLAPRVHRSTVLEQEHEDGHGLVAQVRVPEETLIAGFGRHRSDGSLGTSQVVRGAMCTQRTVPEISILLEKPAYDVHPCRRVWLLRYYSGMVDS